MSVYFVEAGDTGIIKIGKADNLDQRLKQMQPYCPHPLKVLAVAPGGLGAEGRIHERFGKHRLHGEWFRLTDQLRILIAHVAKAGELPRYFQGNDFGYLLREKQRSCKHEVSEVDLDREEYRADEVRVWCRACGRVAFEPRQAVLLEVLRRTYGRLPPLPEPEQTQEAA